MSLPTAICYHPPVETLPRSRADWQIDPGRAALLVHDMQRHFLRPFDPHAPVLTQAVDRIGALTAAARSAGMPVIYTAQPGDQSAESRGLLMDLWGPGIAGGDEHEAVADPIAPQPGDHVLTKHRYSAFARTDLADRLTDLDRDQLVITGVYAHIGVLATATEAFSRDLETFVVADAVADFSAERHGQALELAAATCAVVLPAADVIAATGSRWQDWLCTRLAELLDDPVLAADAVADPDTDLFAIGLDSMRSLTLLDELADLGVDIDLVDLIGTPTSGFVLAATAGVPAP